MKSNGLFDDRPFDIPEQSLSLFHDNVVAGDHDHWNSELPCYRGVDAVLANSGHEPFGLVGLEVMAACGLAFTGSTGEDYAVSFENAICLETDDPDEIVGYLLHLQRNREEVEKIREAGYRTAQGFIWEEAIENLIGKLGYLARKQSIVLD